MRVYLPPIKKWEEIYFQFHFPCNERRASVPPQPVLLFSDVAPNHYEAKCRGTNDNNLDGYSGWAHPGLERKKINQIEANCAVHVQSECFTEESRCDEVQERASVYVFHNGVLGEEKIRLHLTVLDRILV